MSILVSSSYFPNLEYMALFLKGHALFIETAENFQKQSLRSRCEILSANGKQSLSVPVKKESGKKTAFHQVEIDYKGNWMKDHLGALNAAYASSAFYFYYADEIESILLSKPKTLLELNLNCLKFVLKQAQIQVDYQVIQDFNFACADDFRAICNKKHKSTLAFPSYPQVFAEKFPFVENLSSLDLLFNYGPSAFTYLEELANQIKLNSNES